MRILQWLAGHDKGMSSEAIALTALGEMPKRPNYPHDGDDFGRCWRLLVLCPDAKLGLDRLGVAGGPVWAALIERWPEIEMAYLHDRKLSEAGNRNYQEYKCYDLMQSIIRPIEDASRSVIRGKSFDILVPSTVADAPSMASTAASVDRAAPPNPSSQDSKT